MKIKKVGYPGIGLILQPAGLRVMLVFWDFIIPINTKKILESFKSAKEKVDKRDRFKEDMKRVSKN